MAKPDGLTIVNFHGNQVLNQVIGKPGIEFDARKFEYIGVPSQDSGACAFTKASGITSYEQLRTAKAPVKLGGVAPGDTTYNTAKILMEALKLPIQLVAGYKGTAEIRLAAEGGEVAGGCWQWESIKVIWRKGLETGEVSVVLQSNPKPHPELPNIPNAIDLATSERARQLIKAGIHDPARRDPALRFRLRVRRRIESRSCAALSRRPCVTPLFWRTPRKHNWIRIL